MVRSRSRTCSSGSPDASSVTELSASMDPAAADASWLNPLKVLLRADVTVQLRSYRSLFLSFALPLLVLIITSTGGKRAAKLGGTAVVVRLALTVGLVSICAIGYSTSVARDRDKGIFQRLRVTPAPTWTIMGSRWIVQVAAVLVMAVVVLVAAAVIVGVDLSAAGYVLTAVVALLGSAVFLSIGQAIVGSDSERRHPQRRRPAPLPATDRAQPLRPVRCPGHTLRAGVALVSRWMPGDPPLVGHGCHRLDRPDMGSGAGECRLCRCVRRGGYPLVPVDREIDSPV